MSCLPTNAKKTIILIILFLNNKLYTVQSIKALGGALKQNLTEDLTESFRDSTFFDFDTINSNGFVVGLTLMAIGLIAKSQITKGIESIKSSSDESLIKIKTFIKDKFNKTKNINKKIALAKEFGNDFLEIYKGNTGKAFIEITAMCNNYNIDINDLKSNVNEQVDSFSALIKKNYENIEKKIKEKKGLNNEAEKSKRAQLDKEINQLTEITKKVFDELAKIEELQEALSMDRKIKNGDEKDEEGKKTTNEDKKNNIKSEEYDDEKL